MLDIVKENKGKLVFINFFATRCPPCREELPELIDLRKDYPADKVVIVSVSLDTDRQKLESFVEGMDFTYPVYMAEPDVGPLFGISSIPFNLLYDAAGKLVAAGPGISAIKTLPKPSTGCFSSTWQR
ncbi:MAG: TlpA disulfide reductase family protein [Bilophila sp.]